MFFYGLWMAAAAFGLLAGVGERWARGTARAASALALAAYVALLAAAGVWAGSCWDCRVGGDDSRGFLFSIWALYGGAAVAATLLATWAGAGIAALLRRRSRLRATSPNASR